MSSQRLPQVVWRRLFLTERFLLDDPISYQELSIIRPLRVLYKFAVLGISSRSPLGSRMQPIINRRGQPAVVTLRIRTAARDVRGRAASARLPHSPALPHRMASRISFSRAMSKFEAIVP